jgi:hypothetical protein
MEPAVGLSDGRAQLCGAAVGIGEEDRPWPYSAQSRSSQEQWPVEDAQELGDLLAFKLLRLRGDERVVLGGRLRKSDALAAWLAVAASEAGERAIALDLDPQQSLWKWGEERRADTPAVDSRVRGSLTSGSIRSPSAAPRRSERASSWRPLHRGL